MILCAMHRSTDSWVTTFSLQPQPSHSWGHFLPELRNVLGQLPGFPVQKLAAAQDGAEKVRQLGNLGNVTEGVTTAAATHLDICVSCCKAFPAAVQGLRT